MHGLTLAFTVNHILYQTVKARVKLGKWTFNPNSNLVMTLTPFAWTPQPGLNTNP